VPGRLVDRAYLFRTVSSAPSASPRRLRGERRAGRLALIITSRIAVAVLKSALISAVFPGMKAVRKRCGTHWKHIL